jgi:GNAT superfamily N-acetyltransferase
VTSTHSRQKGNNASSDDTLAMLAGAVQEGLRSLSLGAGGSVEEVDGAICWFSSSHVPVFNGTGIFTERLLNRDTLTAINKCFTARERPYCLVVVDGLVSNAPERLSSLGYWEYDHMPAMVLDGPPLEWRSPDLPSGLNIVRVVNRSDLLSFRFLLSRVFHIPAPEVDLIMSGKTLTIPHVRHYLGRVGHRTIATATLVLTEPLASIWNVGTLPEYRRQGIGTALMRHTLDEAREEGYRSNMLLASPDGVPMYVRLGYRTLSTVRVFVPRYAGY